MTKDNNIDVVDVQAVNPVEGLLHGSLVGFKPLTFVEKEFSQEQELGI